jgi:hypothetical protein
MSHPTFFHRTRIAPAAIALLALLPAAVHAGPRSSAAYTIRTETADGGGRHTASASYSNDGSLGEVAGVGTVAAPVESVNHGYIGQHFEITGLTLTAASNSINETANGQLGAWQALNDATFLAVPATSVTWSVANGPLAGISTSGLATAAAVFQDTAATAQGTFGGHTGTLGLTVLNTSPDNFGSYAGDGLADDWQVQYFGQDNPDAAPLLDPDGDGQTNVFEFTAGLVPIDAASRFVLSIAAVPGQPGQKNLIFSPRLTDRTYVVKAKANLTAATWDAITASAPSDNGLERTITDLSAAGAARFYHVEITKP